MTITGVMRLKYAELEARPSRFYDVAAYQAWCVRADKWAMNLNGDK